MQIIKYASISAALFVGSLSAQDLTPQQFKTACQTSPGNTVVVNTPLKLSNFSTRVNVTTGCRVVFGANGKLEADSINMGFAGPLVFQGGLKSGVVIVKTLLEAPSVSFDLAGGENQISLGESTVRATTGNLTVNAGPSSQVTVASRFAGRAQAMIAAGSINITGGSKLDASLSSTALSGATGINITGAGNEMTLNVANSNLLAASGAISITSPGVQASLDFNQGQLRAGTGITVSFSGNEGQLQLQQVNANAGSGSASFVTALGGARPAKSIIIESIIVANSLSVLAAANGQSGEAALESSRVTSTGDVIVRSGPGGTTNVKLNTLRSGSLVGAYAGPSGSCTAEGNTVVSPAQALCLP